MTVLADAPSKPKLMSIDEFMAMPDSDGYELVEGVLMERKLTGASASRVAAALIVRLGMFVEQRHLGHVFESEAIHRCFDHPNTGRRPDVSLVRSGRFPNERVPDGDINVPADLPVEVVSPNDLANEVEEKVKLYLDHGFGEVWVVYSTTRTVYVYRKGEPIL